MEVEIEHGLKVERITGVASVKVFTEAGTLIIQGSEMRRLLEAEDEVFSVDEYAANVISLTHCLERSENVS